MENKIKEVLDGLVAGIDKEIEENYSDVIDKLLTDKYLDWKDPDNTNVMYFYETTKFIPHLLKRVYPGIDGANMSRVCFVYQHYDFLSHSIRALVDMGYGCCADKTRWVIKQYLNKCLGGEPKEIPNRHAKEHHYAHPDFGCISHWMDYIESLYNMFYKGFSPEVSECHNKLFGMKESIQVVIGEENQKVNFFYRNLDERIAEFFNAGKIDFSSVSHGQRLEITQSLRMDIIQDTLTEEKILKVIKENV